MQELLKPFEQFGVSFVIDDVDDYGQYGLDHPVCTIHLETADKSYDVRLGNFSNMDSERYVSIGDGKVYLVKDDPLNYFNAGLKDMLNRDKVPALDKVTDIRFTGPETYEVVYSEDSKASYSSADVYFKRDGENLLPLDPKLVNAYIKTLQNLNLSDYASYYVSDEEWGTYGLDAPELTIEADYTSKNKDKEQTSGTFTLSISRDPKEKKKAEKEKEENEKDEEITAYARVNGSHIAYKLSSGIIKRLWP